jgi:acetyltransferase-like isoleucine patch superfamily enzyme
MQLIDAKKRELLARRKIGTLHQANFNLPDACIFEPPCSLKWMQVQHSLELGAFSYAVSGYYFAVRIGRYVSIGEQVQIGRHNHPTNWATTSPFFSIPSKNVLDLEIEQAHGVRPADFMLGKPGQQLETTIIGNDVWIGHGAFISPGVTIGDGAVIGACAVVTRDIPPYSIAVGVPATIKKLRFRDSVVQRMIDTKWWRYAFWDLRGASTTEPEIFLDVIENKIRNNEIAEYRPRKLQLVEILGA